MKYILGAYSQLPRGSSREEYETLVSRQLKPLLTMVYGNSSYKLLFRLSISEFEYLETYYPEINMLINELCRRGQMEILTSSYYDVLLQLIPSHERASQIEKTTTYIRRHFTRKPRGLWFYNQVFNPTTVPALSLAGLDYMVISTFNQVNNITESTRPFYTEDMGKVALVFPTDDRFGKLTYDLYRKTVSVDRYLSDAARMAKETSNALTTIMLNLDQIMASEGSSEVFRVLYRNLGDNCTLPGLYIQDNEVARSHYLPNGIYGRDFSIGKASSVNQLIYDSPVLSRNYGTVNMLRDVIRDGRKSIDDRKNADNLLMMASCSSLYFPQECDTPAIRRSTNRNVCEIEATLASMPNFPLPQETDIDFDRSKEYLIAGKSNVSYLSRRGAVLSRFTVTSALFDLAFHNGEGLFADSFVPVNPVRGASKEIRLVSKPYEVTPLDKKSTDFFAKAPQILLGKSPVSVTKRFKFRQSTVIVEIEIENLSDTKLTGFTYTNTVNLALPVKCSCTVPGGELSDGSSVQCQSLVIADKGCPVTISIVLGEDLEVARTDFEQKCRTWLGDKSFYEYTQLRINKQLSLGPYEACRLSIGLRTEKRKEKHNDTTEQSAP